MINAVKQVLYDLALCIFQRTPPPNKSKSEDMVLTWKSGDLLGCRRKSDHNYN